MKWTKCDGCPCLNSDFENGVECNLGYYPVEYKKLPTGQWFNRKLWVYRPNPDGTGFLVEPAGECAPEFSHDWAHAMAPGICRLDEIVYTDGKTGEAITFKPEQVEVL